MAHADTFHDVQFPPRLSYGAKGGPEYKTTVTKTLKGLELRQIHWMDALHKYNVTPNIRSQDDLDELVAFFRARKGKRYSFRFKDWMDFQATSELVGVTDTSTYEFPLVKRYNSGQTGDSHTLIRPISKPIVNTMVVTIGGVTTTIPYIVTTEGVLRFTLGVIPDQLTFATSDDTITRSSGSWITDGVVNGSRLSISGTASNNGLFTVTNVTALTLTVSQNLENEGPVSNVTVHLPPPSSGQEIRWSGDFDVPVRFNTDKMPIKIENFEKFSWDAVMLYEERVPFTPNASTTEATIADFIETRFFEDISEGAQYAIAHDTYVTFSDSGHEERIDRQDFGLMEFDVSFDVRKKDYMEKVLRFFHARRGRGIGFRYKDMFDYQAVDELVATADGQKAEFQLVKNYTSAGITEQRQIFKPVFGTVVIKKNGIPTTTHLVIDATKGTFKFTLGTLSVTFAAGPKTLTRASGSWVTDGIVNGDKVKISGSTNNNTVFTVTNVTASALTVSEVVVEEASIAVMVDLPPLAGVVLRWDGEFDVPVRFDTDEFQVSITNFNSHAVDLKLKEINLAPKTDDFQEGQTGRTTTGVCLDCTTQGYKVGPPSKFAIRFDGNDTLKWGTGSGDFQAKVTGGSQVFGAAFLISRLQQGGTIFNTFGDYGVPQIRLSVTNITATLTVFPGRIQDCIQGVENPPPEFSVYQPPTGDPSLDNPNNFVSCPPSPLHADPCCHNKNPRAQLLGNNFFSVTREWDVSPTGSGAVLVGFVVDVLFNQVLFFGSFPSVTINGNWQLYNDYFWQNIEGECSCRVVPNFPNSFTSRNTLDVPTFNAEVRVLNIITNPAHFDAHEIFLFRFTDRLKIDQVVQTVRLYLNKKYTGGIAVDLALPNLLAYFVSHLGVYGGGGLLEGEGELSVWHAVADKDLGDDIINPWTLSDFLSDGITNRHPLKVDLGTPPLLAGQIPKIPMMYPLGTMMQFQR